MTAIAAPEWFTAALEPLRTGDVDGFLHACHRRKGSAQFLEP
jgi:hypothetical protein